MIFKNSLLVGDINISVFMLITYVIIVEYINKPFNYCCMYYEQLIFTQ